MTIDEQGWITRWDKGRLVGHYLHNIVSLAATFSIIFGLGFLVFHFRSEAIAQSVLNRQAAEQRKELAKTSQSILTTNLPRPSDADLANTKAQLTSAAAADPYGYYVVKLADTVPLLKQKFNIPVAGQILDGQTKAPLNNFTPLTIGRQLAIKVADLRHPLTPFVPPFSLFAKPPRVTYDAPTNTIFVKQGGSTATLTRIKAALGLANQKLLQQTAPGVWILRANMYIGKNVRLVVSSPETTQLRLESSDGGFIWLRAESGDLLFSNTSVTSWDESKNGPDTDVDNGRAFVVAKNSGRMDIINSDLGYLGYVGSTSAGGNRGGAFGGSYGVSWRIKSGGLKDSLMTGVVTGNKFHDNFFGFYTFGVTGMLVQNNESFNNINYGFDPHTGSNNILLDGNKAYHNGSHGIIFSLDCNNNTISNNTSYDNRLHGVMLDRTSNNNLVQGNTVYGNTDGIAIHTGSSDNLILGNTIRNNVRGIRVNAGSAGNYAEQNVISSNSRGIYIYDQSPNNIFLNNQVIGSDIAIVLKGASNNILLNNFKPSDNKKDGEITSDANGNNIQ